MREANSAMQSTAGLDRSSPLEASLPGSVPDSNDQVKMDGYDASRAEHSANNGAAVLAKRSHEVKNAARLVNSEWEDSESDYDEEVLDRVIKLRKEETKLVGEEKKKPDGVGIVKFERRKRQIAGRFQTRRELVAFEKEEGPQVGGQWIDQKWVSNKVLNIKKDEFTIQKWVKDLGTYLILLFAFTYIIFTGSGNSEFSAYQRVWRNMVRPRVEMITSPDSAIAAIEKLVLWDLVGSRQDYVPGYAPPGGPGTKVLLGSILVGKIRLRQLRVQGQPCSKVHKMLKDSGMVQNSECYPAYTSKMAEIRYSKENLVRQEVYSNFELYPYFTYRSALETNYLPVSGWYGEYDSSGYIAEMDLSDANTTLADLRDFQWVDKKTRALFIDFSFYNDDIGLFVTNNVLIEFASGQAPVSTVRGERLTGPDASSRLTCVCFLLRASAQVDVSAISPMDFRSGDSNDLTRLGMLVLVFIMVIYYALEELDLCRATGLDRYKSVSWAYLDFVNISLFILAGLLKGYNLVAYEIAIPTGVEDEDMLGRIVALGRSKYLHDKIQGLNGFLLWFKLFKYVTITRPLMRMSRVLSVCVPDILTYGFLFWVILVAFAVLGYLFCGNELETFASIESSILTIMRSMYGDFDFDGLVEVSGVTGFIYLGLWLVTSNIVLVNMFIAILSETYHRVTEEERATPTDTTYSKILEQLERRKAESEQLRNDAIVLYGKKKYAQEQKQRQKVSPKGRVHCTAHARICSRLLSLGCLTGNV